jgi:hypothetical protein
MSDEAKKKSRACIWWATAAGLLPLSFVMWWFGLEGAWSDRPELDLGHLIWGLIFILSPFFALTGALWLLVLCVLHARESAKSERKS